MAKTKEVATVTAAAGLAARSLARLEAAAQAVHAESEKKDRSLQLISTKAGFSAVIRHGKTMIEISGDDFAISKSE